MMHINVADYLLSLVKFGNHQRIHIFPEVCSVNKKFLRSLAFTMSSSPIPVCCHDNSQLSGGDDSFPPSGSWQKCFPIKRDAEDCSTDRTLTFGRLLASLMPVNKDLITENVIFFLSAKNKQCNIESTWYNYFSCASVKKWSEIAIKEIINCNMRHGEQIFYVVRKKVKHIECVLGTIKYLTVLFPTNC